MALPAIYNTQAEIPPEFAGEYKPGKVKDRAGKEHEVFLLDVTGMDSQATLLHPVLAGLRGSFDKVTREKATLQQSLDALKARLEGLPDDFSADQYAILKAAAEAHDEGGTPEEKERRRKEGAEARKLLEQQIATLKSKHDGDLKAKDAAIADLEGFVNKLLIEDGISKALDEGGVAPEFKEAAAAVLRQTAPIKVEKPEGGDRSAVVKTDLGDMSIAKYAADWLAGDKGKIFVKKPTGGGAEGSDLRRGETNPFEKTIEKGHNMTQQGVIIRSDRVKAERLMKAASWSQAEMDRVLKTS